MARNATSAAPAISAASDLRAASKQEKETGTPRRAAISRARSAVTPVGSSLVPWARTGLPRLIDARSTPVGARSATTAGSVTRCSFGDGATQTQDLKPVNSQLGPNVARPVVAALRGIESDGLSEIVANWGTFRLTEAFCAGRLNPPTPVSYPWLML